MGSEAKLKHNKKRNTGLIYEFLIRKLSQSLIEKNMAAYKSSVNILKKYFSPDQPLCEEKRLFDVLLTTKVQNKQSANNLLNEIKINASKLNFRFLDIKKSNLLKEINKKFGQDFFNSYRLDDYRQFASIQLLINGCNKKRTLEEGIGRVAVEEQIVDFLMNGSRKEIKEMSNESSKYDEIVHAMALKKFNERYGKTLCESQKHILKKYVLHKLSNNNLNIKKFINETKQSLLKQIDENSNIKEINEYKLVKDKLDEAKNYYNSINLDNIVNYDGVVEDLMLGYKLIEELKSNE